MYVQVLSDYILQTLPCPLEINYTITISRHFLCHVYEGGFAWSPQTVEAIKLACENQLNWFIDLKNTFPKVNGFSLSNCSTWGHAGS